MSHLAEFDLIGLIALVFLGLVSLTGISVPIYLLCTPQRKDED